MKKKEKKNMEKRSNYEKEKYQYKFNSELLKAAFFGNIPQILQLIENGGNVNFKDKTFFLSPIHFASQEGQTEVVELLIDKGADINITDNEGRTALHYAIIYGHIEVVESLISKGANLNLKDCQGWNSLSLSLERGYEKIALKLMEERVKVQKKDLFWAISSGLSQAVKKMLSNNKFNLNRRDKLGRTPLHYAYIYTNKNIIDLLISKGADINIKDNDGKTPSDYYL